MCTKRADNKRMELITIVLMVFEPKDFPFFVTRNQIEILYAKEMDKGTVVVVYPPSCSIAMDFNEESYPGITKFDLCLDDEMFQEKLKNNLSQYESNFTND